MQEQLTYSNYLINKSFIPKNILEQIPTALSPSECANPMLYVKIIDDFSGDTLYIAESKQHDDDVDFYGFIFNPLDIEHQDLEFKLSDFVNQEETLFPYRIDNDFVPVRLSEVIGDNNENF
ncbi:MAG: hypothetical protein EBT51_09405 [Flavobacteriaceae bacterium]|jgi:hypothetical protein|nr:hypothetical protein [Flavobacteriaceae bacterium]